MRRLAASSLAALVLVPASAGAGTTRPPLGLTATPAHVALAGSSRATVRVTNPGLSPVVVDVGRAGFSLDLRGRPKIVARGDGRAASAWLTVRPARFVLGGRSEPIPHRGLAAPARVEPGDHDALVLLTTRPRRGAGVAVRMRIGIVVVVRAPGRIVRRLALGRLRVRRQRGDTRSRALRGQPRERDRVARPRRRAADAPTTARASRSCAPIRATSGREPAASCSSATAGRWQDGSRATARIAVEPGRAAVFRTYRVKL